MTSDGLGACSIKQEVDEKENRHVEQSQAKVNEQSCPVPQQGSQSQCREFLRREVGPAGYGAELPGFHVSTLFSVILHNLELPFCLRSSPLPPPQHLGNFFEDRFLWLTLYPVSPGFNALSLAGT